MTAALRYTWREERNGTGGDHLYKEDHCFGGIVAIKGIGGFHLCCDATSEEAVQRLRQRKRRPVKPFAVMAQDMEAVKKICQVSEEQRRSLPSSEADPAVG